MGGRRGEGGLPLCLPRLWKARNMPLWYSVPLFRLLSFTNKSFAWQMTINPQKLTAPSLLLLYICWYDYMVVRVVFGHSLFSSSTWPLSHQIWSFASLVSARKFISSFFRGPENMVFMTLVTFFFFYFASAKWTSLNYKADSWGGSHISQQIL